MNTTLNFFYAIRQASIQNEPKKNWKIDGAVHVWYRNVFFSPFNWRIYLESHDHSLWCNTSTEQSQSITSKLNESHEVPFCAFFPSFFLKNKTKSNKIGERNHPSPETSISSIECDVCVSLSVCVPHFVWIVFHMKPAIDGYKYESTWNCWDSNTKIKSS